MAESPAVVRRELARVKAAGLPVREETGVTCCHANQDKFWVEDPDGVEWERIPRMTGVGRHGPIQRALRFGRGGFIDTAAGVC